MNRFQGINSASLCSLAGRYGNLIPTRFPAPIDCLKIPALKCCGVLVRRESQLHGYYERSSTRKTSPTWHTETIARRSSSGQHPAQLRDLSHLAYRNDRSTIIQWAASSSAERSLPPGIQKRSLDDHPVGSIQLSWEISPTWHTETIARLSSSGQSPAQLRDHLHERRSDFKAFGVNKKLCDMNRKSRTVNFLSFHTISNSYMVILTTTQRLLWSEHLSHTIVNRNKINFLNLETYTYHTVMSILMHTKP